MAAIYSPYFRAHPQVLSDFAASERLPLKVFMMQGIYDFDVENTRQLHSTLQEKGYPLLFLETADGHSWGNWRGVMDDMLRFFFGRSENSRVSFKEDMARVCCGNGSMRRWQVSS